MSGISRLVVGASGSPASLAALRYARDLAEGHHVPLLAVLAWTPPGGEYADRRYPSQALRQEWKRAFAARLAETLGNAWGGVPMGLNATMLLFRGKPGPALVEAADSPGDQLILGAGRRDWPAGIGHGRVNRYCAAHARCPVVSVPQAATARELGLSPAGWALLHWELTVDRAERHWRTAA